MKGSYTLLIKLNKNSRVKIGKLGTLNFSKGYYVYVGSAMNSLEARINRHLRKNKKLFWHIDYLLNSKYSKIVDVLKIPSRKKRECEIARKIKGEPVLKFGSSDCKCPSHLFYFNRRPNLTASLL